MKTKRNYKFNRICRKLYSRYRKNVISLVTAAVLLVTSMPLADVSKVVSKMVSTLTNAISAMAADTYTDISDNISNGVYTIQNADDFKNLLNADPQVYQNITIQFSNNTSQFKDTDFTGIEKGLGTQAYPFSGIVTANEGSGIRLPISFALFEYLSDSATLAPITFVRSEDNKNTALLAENLTHDNSVISAEKWEITVEPASDSEKRFYNSFTSVIGNMNAGAIAGLDISLDSDIQAEISGTDNAGLACGTMEKNAQLTVGTNASNFTVAANKTNNSNAGSLVGKMGSGATLTIDKGYSFTGTVTGGNAGGIVGNATDGFLAIAESGSVKVTGTVKGYASADNNPVGAAGGMFGTYTFSSAGEGCFLSDLDLANWSDINVTLDTCGAGSGKVVAGGLFGLLKNTTTNDGITIRNKDDKIINSSLKNTNSKNASCYGGIVGRYQAEILSASFTLNNVNTNLISLNKVNDVGGIIGNIYNEQRAYVKIDSANVTMPDKSESSSNNGGLIGYVYRGPIDVCGNIKITDKGASATNFGGLVGRFVDSGSFLRISGKTDLTDAYPASASATRCQIVGKRADALVYAVGNGTDADSGWQLIRNNQTDLKIDDLDWGGVLRLDGTKLTESVDINQSRETDVLYFDKDAHTVTIKGFTSKDVEIKNEAYFARAALIMQHSSNSFVKYSGSIDRTKMLEANISLSADIDISDVGLTGFMRDNGKDTFTGTFNGNGHKITMNVGKETPIVYHTHNGLFAKTSGATISNLTLTSNLNVIGDNSSGGDMCYIGSVSSYNSGALTVDNVTANVKASPSGAFTNFVGGLVGYVADATSDVSFTDSAVKADLTYNAGTTSKDCTVLGGVIGLVDGVSSEPADDTGIKFNNVTVSGKITDKHSGSNARVGGLIAEVRGKAENVSNNDKHNNIFIKNVNIDNLTINASGKVNNSGGFFGHNWYRVEVTLDSLTVNECSLNVMNGTELGGLVLSTTGYWKISKVNFASTVVNAPSAYRYGMLAATLFGRSSDPYGFNYQTGAPGSGYGCSSDATYFELIDPNGYKITGTTITIKPSYTMFDEIAARSLKETVEFVSNAQAIISIPAVNENGEYLVDMDGEHCNTYQNQTKNDTANWNPNPNSRYYYNIHKYKDEPKKLKTGGERLMQWSTRLFAADNIKKYIYDGSISFPTDKEIDLNGYSYYPVDTAGCTIGTSEFTFYNKEFNKSEELSNGGADGISRTTAGTDTGHSQHYMMQSGIFRNCNSSTGNPLDIRGKLTLKGSIGKVNNGSGALICGSVTNGDSKSRRTVTINGSIVLDDLYVNDSSINTSSYAPLLINKIGDVSTITIRNVSAEKHKTTATKYGMNNQDYAATSLIGEVGSSTGHDITLEFSGIKLAASDENSIFSRATLLESFQHSDGASSAIYNYTWLEDWGNGAKHNVTYGKEVSKTIKNVDSDGISRQNKYYNYWKENNWYTSPDENNRTKEYNFSNYRPYVAKSAVTNYTDATKKYDEIDVNLKRPYLNDGCGTYSDPYILDASTLEEVARVISSTPTNGWEVNYNANVSTDQSTVDSSKAFCKGSDHTLYTFNGDDSKFEDEKGNTVTTDAMLKYLCEAYYKINGDIVLGSSFAGLGGTSDKYAFRGVIVGQKKADGTYPTITNKSSSSLIRFSNGSVVKDLNIVNEGEISLTKTSVGKISYSTTFSQCYGGVIGIVFGGDNIIDNVSVKLPNISFSVNADTKKQYNYLITAGGYVGAIVYGGVVFRNMGEAAKSSKLNIAETAETYTQNLYINPYIGRVVNGFAIEEGNKFGKSTNLDNGRKNYLITQFKSELSDDEKLKVIAGTPNTIEIPNAQALFMLSVISQSGMGYTDNYNNTCGYGYYTFTRNADYSKVGADELTSGDEDYKAAISDYQRLELKKDNVQNNKVSVMLKKYTNKSNYYEAKWAYVANKKFTVKLTGTDTYDLTGTGFRGINQLFNTNISDVNDEYTLSIAEIIGTENSNTEIKLDEDIKAYVTDSTKDDPYGQIKSIDNYSYKNGVGLLNYTSYSTNVENITLSGNVSLRSFDQTGSIRFCENTPTGGLIGKVNSGISSSFTNIVVKDLEVQGAYSTGGLVGKSDSSVVLDSIKSSGKGVSVYGGFETGGLIGCMNYDLTISDADVKIGQVKSDYLKNANIQNWFGIGGVVGTAYGNININNVSVSAAGEDSFVGSVNENGVHSATRTMTVGGIIGLTYKQNTETKITDSTANIDLYGRNSGGIIGQNGTYNYNSASAIITSCTFGNTDNNSSQPVVNGCESSGGIIGKQYSPATISKSLVKNATLGIPSALSNNVGIGGYVGVKAKGDLKITDCEVNGVTLLASDTTKGAGVGGVIGHNDDGSTYAYDILINKFSYVRFNNSVSVSNLIGWNNSKDLASKFIGVSVNNSDCLPDVQYSSYEVPTSFTAVHADYNGVQDNTENIGEGSGTHVDINSPYVNINPSKTVGDKIFTGDFVGGNMEKIISDAASYTNSAATKSYGRNSTLKGYAEELDTSKLTTFAKASELDVEGLNALPVLLIDDNSSANITEMLAKYISLLTNCDVYNSSTNTLKTTDIKNVSTATYVYDNGVLTEAVKKTLTFNSKTGYFKVTDGQYDNDGTNRFTVITLEYADPTDSSKTALRLHIPVFVKKVLDFSFQSYVISGTDYNHSHYTDKTKLAFESFDAPVTTYFKYSYYKTADEWSKMLNNGDDLLWSFDKELYLLGENAAASGVLTDNTKLTLIDANNSDKTYHSTASEAGFNKETGMLDLTKIGDFKPITMNDILLRYATVSATESADGTLVEADEKTATMKTSDGKYYRPAEENDTDATKYSISVTKKNTTVLDDSERMIISESYYLTINIPESESTNKVIKNFVNYYGSSPRKLKGQLPTHLIYVTNNNDTGAYVIANFFTQKVTVDAFDPEEITTSNNYIHAVMKSKITINPALRETFKGYKSDGFEMYQAFKFSMKKFDDKDVGANAKIIAGASLNVDYSILNSADTELDNAKISRTETISEATDSYMLMYPNSVYDFISDDANGSITVKADLKITYGPAGIIEQFPERKDGDTKTGIGVNAASYVAYSQNNIENSSISENGTMPATRYYRMAMTVAQLSYNVAESTVLESKDSPFSQLGINAKDMTSDEMTITANAIYDLSALSQSTRDSGKRIQYTMKLYVKDGNGEYKQTDDISKYLSSFTLENATSNSGLNGSECVFTTNYSGEEQSTAVTKFVVKTGKTFEDQDLTYANYRVELTAVLLNNSNTVVNGTTASDYVVYTNAKIETGFINS